MTAPRDVAALEEAEPRDARGRGLHPARDGGQRCAHRSVGGSRQIPATRPRSRSRDPAAPQAVYTLLDQRQHEKHRRPITPIANLEQCIHAQWMTPSGNKSRQQEAPQAHAAHERAEQHAERYRGGANEQLQHLKPDDLVNHRRRSRCRQRAAAAPGAIVPSTGRRPSLSSMPPVCSICPCFSRHTRPCQHFRKMESAPAGVLRNLLAAAESIGHDARAGLRRANRRQQHALAVVLRHRVALLLEPERPGHAAASRVEHVHLAACRVQHRHLIFHVEDGAVMTMHVDQHLLLPLRRRVIRARAVPETRSAASFAASASPSAGRPASDSTASSLNTLAQLGSNTTIGVPAGRFVGQRTIASRLGTPSPCRACRSRRAAARSTHDAEEP